MLGNTMDKLTIGLDWDGVISDYAPALSFLVQLFQYCVVITLNDEITNTIASQTLNLELARLKLEICPDNRIDDYYRWKAEMCIKHHVNLMFDDDPEVILACLEVNIHAITVREFCYKYKKS
jgi:hypothetical protein